MKLVHELDELVIRFDEQIAQIVGRLEVDKKLCLAGILRAQNCILRRTPPYHRALTVLVMAVLLLPRPTRAQTVEVYRGILIDTSASISRGGKSNELFHEYLRETKKLLLTEPPNSRVVVRGISTNSFGASEILNGWTPDARGVFTDDLDRARQQLVANFGAKFSRMSPVASSTDIFGALWHLKVLFESDAQDSDRRSPQKEIWILSDMMNDTKEFSMPERIELGPQQLLDHAKAESLIVPLRGYKVHVCGATTTGTSHMAWRTIKAFWTAYYAAAGAELVSYSVDVDCER